MIGSPTIFGAACALEEQKQPHGADDTKVALMGTFAGIGDTIAAILMKPIFAVFAVGMALIGKQFGAVLMLILGFIYFYVMFPGFWLGYNQGKNLVQTAGSKVLTTFSNLASMAALIIMGGFIPYILGGDKTPIQFTRSLVVEGKTVQQVVNIQMVIFAIEKMINRRFTPPALMSANIDGALNSMKSLWKSIEKVMVIEFL